MSSPTKPTISEDASTGAPKTPAGQTSAAPVRTGTPPDSIGSVLAAVGVRSVPPTEHAPAVVLPVTDTVKTTNAQMLAMLRGARDGSA